MSLTPTVLIDARIYYASLDVTGYGNKVEVATSVENLEKTTFASNGWKERVGGLADTTAMATMFWQAGDLTMPDDVLWAQLGLSSPPLTICETAGTVGHLAYLTKVLQSDYKIGGNDVGKLLTADASWAGNSALTRGQIMHPQGTARTTTGTGTGLQIGAVLTSQRFYANLHVLSVSGSTPTLTVKIQSSVDNTFASPTDQITFTAATGLTSQASSVLGAVTDTWWRAVWTIGGSTPSWMFAVSGGVAAK